MKKWIKVLVIALIPVVIAGLFISYKYFLKYDYRGSFNEGYFVVEENGKSGFMNLFGITKITPVYDRVYVFSNGYARVSIQDKWGVINKEGDYIIYPQFGEIDVIIDGYARVSSEAYDFWKDYNKTRKFGLISLNGMFVCDTIFEEIGYYDDYYISEGLIRVRYQGKEGHIDLSNEVVIPLIYDMVLGFSEGLSAVSNNGKWGYIDKENNLIIDFQYNYAGQFSEGLAAVKIGKRYGYINHKNEVIIPPIYSSASLFKNGYAEVMVGDDPEYEGSALIPNPKYGIINRSGAVVLPAIYEHIWIRENGTVIARQFNGERKKIRLNSYE